MFEAKKRIKLLEQESKKNNGNAIEGDDLSLQIKILFFIKKTHKVNSDDVSGWIIVDLIV